MKKLKGLKFWVQSFNQAQQAVQDAEVLLEFFKAWENKNKLIREFNSIEMEEEE